MIKKKFLSDNDDIMKIRQQLGNDRLLPNHDKNMNNPLVLYLNKSCANPVNLEAYDVINNLEFIGHRNKTFMLADGDVFSPLYHELRNNPKSSYATYLNDEIKQGYEPEHLSVLVYEAICDPTDELFNSRLLNLLDVPTVYMQNLTNIDDYNYLLSVDFVGKDEEFIPLDELTYRHYIYDTEHIVYYDFYTTMEDIDELIHDGLEHMYKTKRLHKSDDFISGVHHDIMSNLLYQRAITKYVLGLTDGESKNNGILFNKKTHVSHVAPAFDLEQMCITWRFVEDDQMLVKDLEYLRDNYPEVLHRLDNTFHRINTPMGKKQIQDIKNDYPISDRVYQTITHNIEVFSDMIQEMNNEEMGDF